MMSNLTAEKLDAHDDAVLDELVVLYRDKLVPELVCAAPGSPDRPSPGWLRSEGRHVYGVRDETGELVGAWVVRDDSIYYPVADVSEGVPGVARILKALWKECTEHHENLTAKTDNPVIMKWAKQAVSPKSVTKIKDYTLAWKKPKDWEKRKP